MTKNINIPIVIGFDSMEQAEAFLNAAELIVPKLKMEDLGDVDAATNQHLFLFYTRKDKNYRDILANYTTATTSEEVIQFTEGSAV